MDDVLFDDAVSVETRRPTYIHHPLHLVVQTFGLYVVGWKRQFDHLQAAGPGVVATCGCHTAGVFAHVGRSNGLDLEGAVFENVDARGQSRID